MPGARSHPQPRVRKKQHTSSVTTGTPHQPAFPARWFYGFLRALPGDRAFLPPSLVNSSTNLAPASGRQNHTTSPSATALLVLQHHQRPSHPASRFVTIAIRPLGGAGWHRSIAVSTNRKSEIFFEDWLDRPNQLEIACENRVLAHGTAAVIASPRVARTRGSIMGTAK